MQSSRAFLLTCLAAAALTGACGFGSSSDLVGGSSNEGGTGFGGMNVGGYGLGGSGGSINPPGPFTYSGLCGIETCTPGDLATPCVPDDGGGSPGVGGAGGGSAGAGGADEGGAPEGGAGGTGGAGGAGGSPENVACQIADQDGTPGSVCATTGTTIINGVCNSSADCLPGLGCVLASTGENEGGGPPSPAVGICRPYCCDALEKCPESTFCAPEPMFDAAAALEDPTAALPIPVCKPTSPCQLLGTDCPEGATCSVVRADGDTSCIPIGPGTLCQPCPCAVGFVCNFGTGECQQLCDTMTNDCPGIGAVCGGGITGLPDNVGYCIGGDSVCDQ